MKRSLLIIVMLAMAASGASAQYLQQGDKEITFSGSLFSVSGLTLITMSGSYGYYHTSRPAPCPAREWI